MGGGWLSSAFNAAAHIATAPIRLAEQAVLTPTKILAHATTGIPVLSQIASANLKLTSSAVAAGNRLIQTGVNVVGSQQVHTPGTTAAPSLQQGAAAVGASQGVNFIEQYNGHSVWLQAAAGTFVVDYTTIPAPSFALGPFPTQAAAEAAIDQMNAQSAGSAPFPDGSYQQMTADTPAPASGGSGLLTIVGVAAAGAGAYFLAK